MYKILIVDDEMIFRKGIRTMIQKSELPVECLSDAQNGEEAWTMLAKEMYDIVITDIRMPYMDGLMLCQMIYEKGWDPIVIILSGYDDFKYAQKAIQFGVSDYVLKPVSSKRLLEILNHAITDREKKMPKLSYDEMDQLVCSLFEALWNQNMEKYTKLGKTIQLKMEIYTERKKKEILDEILENTAGKVERLLEERIFVKETRGEKFEKRMEKLWKEVYEQRHYSVLEKVKCALHKNPALTQEEICSELGMSVAHFSYIFKEKTGKKFVDFRREVRMEIAKQKLCIPAKTITQVALESGYSDYSHFSQMFRKYYGITPTQFREERGIVS